MKDKIFENKDYVFIIEKFNFFKYKWGKKD